MSHAENMKAWREGVKASYGAEWDRMLERAEKALCNMEFVRSRYRAPWYGIVLNRQKRKGVSDLCTIRVLKDRRGNWVRKPWVTTLSDFWVVPTKRWMDLDAPYNTGIPVAVLDERWDIAEEVLKSRARKKYLKRVLRGYDV